MQKKGFTLLEVLIVAIILASVVLFAAPAYKKAQARAQYNAALGTLIQFGEGIRALGDDMFPLLAKLQEHGNVEVPSIWTNDSPAKLEQNWFTSATTNAAVANLDKTNRGEFAQALTNDEDLFKAALVELGYMPKPRLQGPFEYYICNEFTASDSSCCPGYMENRVIACMYIPNACDDNSKKEFSMAYYHRNGEYERVEHCNN